MTLLQSVDKKDTDALNPEPSVFATLTRDQLVHVKRPNVEAFGEIGEDALENVAT